MKRLLWLFTLSYLCLGSALASAANQQDFDACALLLDLPGKITLIRPKFARPKRTLLALETLASGEKVRVRFQFLAPRAHETLTLKSLQDTLPPFSNVLFHPYSPSPISRIEAEATLSLQELKRLHDRIEVETLTVLGHATQRSPRSQKVFRSPDDLALKGLSHDQLRAKVLAQFSSRSETGQNNLEQELNRMRPMGSITLTPRLFRLQFEFLRPWLQRNGIKFNHYEENQNRLERSPSPFDAIQVSLHGPIHALMRLLLTVKRTDHDERHSWVLTGENHTAIAARNYPGAGFRLGDNLNKLDSPLLNRLLNRNFSPHAHLLFALYFRTRPEIDLDKAIQMVHRITEYEEVDMELSASTLANISRGTRPASYSRFPVLVVRGSLATLATLNRIRPIQTIALLEEHSSRIWDWAWLHGFFSNQ